MNITLYALSLYSEHLPSSHGEAVKRLEALFDRLESLQRIHEAGAEASVAQFCSAARSCLRSYEDTKRSLL